MSSKGYPPQAQLVIQLYLKVPDFFKLVSFLVVNKNNSSFYRNLKSKCHHSSNPTGVFGAQIFQPIFVLHRTAVQGQFTNCRLF